MTKRLGAKSGGRCVKVECTYLHVSPWWGDLDLQKNKVKCIDPYEMKWKRRKETGVEKQGPESGRGLKVPISR